MNVDINGNCVGSVVSGTGGFLGGGRLGAATACATMACAAKAANTITPIVRYFPCLILPPKVANKSCEPSTSLLIIRHRREPTNPCGNKYNCAATPAPRTNDEPGFCPQAHPYHGRSGPVRHRARYRLFSLDGTPHPRYRGDRANRPRRCC